MPDDLRAFDAWLAQRDWPSPPCPECLSGQLSPVGDLADHQTSKSERWRNEDENWEPDWIHGWFTGVMKCNRHQCQELVVITGEMRVTPDEDEQGRWYGEYVSEYRLRHALPALPLTGSLPTGVPEIVQQRIAQASAVLWEDPSAAGNRLRLGVEDLLTALRVRKLDKNRKPLRTQNRIDVLAKTKPDVAATLEAVKWIGNEGSHDAVLTATEVLDGVDILVHALESLYDTKKIAIVRKVTAINAKKGVPRKRAAKKT